MAEADGAETRARPQHGLAKSALVVGALGVVFGDIGTSPIYTIQTIFNPDDPHPVSVTTDNVYGIVSLIF
jgi:KUP system potassium uptake protein